MNRTSILTLSFLLLWSWGQQMNGQKKEPRRLFPIDHDRAFIDLKGQVVISSTQPELLAEALRVSATVGEFRRFGGETPQIRFGEFSEGLAIARWALCPGCRNPNMVSGFIDETGRLVIGPKGFESRYGSFSEGLAHFTGYQSGFIDRRGRTVISLRFREAGDFSEGLAFVRLMDDKPKFGYINRKGALVIPYQFLWASDFHDGLAAVKLSRGALGFIDKTGKVVLSSKAWVDIRSFSEGLASVKITFTNDSVYRGYQDVKYGYIDRHGKVVIPPSYYDAREFSEGRALVFQEGKDPGYGYIDSQGQIVIKPQYVDGKSFAEGLAAVAISAGNQKKLWGYINREGTWVIKPQFEHVNSFDGGLAAVDCDQYDRNCQAYIDPSGKFRWKK